LGVAPETPDAAQQLLAGEHALGLGDQREQQLVLLAAQRFDLDLADPRAARPDIEPQRPGTHHVRCAAGVRAAQQRPESGSKLGIGVGLAEHVVSATLQQPRAVQLSCV
jgi:hypothetical protein